MQAIINNLIQCYKRIWNLKWYARYLNQKITLYAINESLDRRDSKYTRDGYHLQEGNPGAPQIKATHDWGK